MLNPQTATITLDPPNATQFRLQYHYAGIVRAELVVAANFVSGNQYSQPLAGLNALVPGDVQGSDLSLSASAINSGGESAPAGCLEHIQVVNPPNQPSSITVS